MKRSALAALSVVFALTQVAADAHAAPAARTRAAVDRAQVQRVKQHVSLAVKPGAAVPGETRTVEATLSAVAGGAPVAGKRITFKLSGHDPLHNRGVVINLGQATTNAQGKASLDWQVGDLGAAAYTLKGTFAADSSTMGAMDTANFGILKAITQVSLGNLIWGPLDSHGGGNFPVIMVSVKRTSDSQSLAKVLTLTVNGQTRLINQAGSSQSSTIQLLLQPTDAPSWNVKVQFLGDAAYQASEAQRSYNHP